MEKIHLSAVPYSLLGPSRSTLGPEVGSSRFPVSRGESTHLNYERSRKRILSDDGSSPVEFDPGSVGPTGFEGVFRGVAGVVSGRPAADADLQVHVDGLLDVCDRVFVLA